MRQIWNKCKNFILTFVLNILLPLIFSVIFFGVIDFTALTTSTNVDLASMLGKVRTNRSIFDLIASMQNALSLIGVFCVDLFSSVKCFFVVNFKNVKLNIYCTRNEFIAKNCNEFVFNKLSVTYLRI